MADLVRVELEDGSSAYVEAADGNLVSPGDERSLHRRRRLPHICKEHLRVVGEARARATAPPPVLVAEARSRVRTAFRTNPDQARAAPRRQ